MATSPTLVLKPDAGDLQNLTCYPNGSPEVTRLAGATGGRGDGHAQGPVECGAKLDELHAADQRIGRLAGTATTDSTRK